MINTYWCWWLVLGVRAPAAAAAGLKNTAEKKKKQEERVRWGQGRLVGALFGRSQPVFVTPLDSTTSAVAPGNGGCHINVTVSATVRVA
jgi:hypothetical protein